jgi:hypothetical protein
MTPVLELPIYLAVRALTAFIQYTPVCAAQASATTLVEAILLTIPRFSESALKNLEIAIP